MNKAIYRLLLFIQNKKQKYSFQLICCINFLLLVFFPVYPDAGVSWYKYAEIPGMNFAKVVMTSPFKGFLGIYNESKTEHPLFFFENGKWQQDTSFPLDTHRTFVMDALSENFLMVWGYSPELLDKDTVNGKLLKFNGYTWEVLLTAGGFPKSMDIVSEKDVWIGFNGSCFLHLSGSKQEVLYLDIPEETRKKYHIYDIQMLNVEEGWACGPAGLLTHYTGGRWQLIPLPDPLNDIFFEKLDVTEDGAVWITGEKGIIARYQPQEKEQWKIFTVPGELRFFGIDMLSAQEGWCVGEKGSIFYYNGLDWEKQPSPVTDTLRDIQMLNSTEGWISGNRVILHATAGERNLFQDISTVKNLYMNNQFSTSGTLIDFDGDKDLDIFFAGGRVFINDGRATFYELPADSGISAEIINNLFTYCAWGDFDCDGDLDFYFKRQKNNEPRRIYENKGNYRFALMKNTEVLKKGLEEVTAAYCIDYDNDADMDLYIVRQYEKGQVPAANFLFENQGYGAFKLSEVQTGTKNIDNLALWGDLNGDLYPDLILIGHFMVYLNDGKGGFQELTKGLKEWQHNMPIDQALLFDEDRDGDLDLFVVMDYPYLLYNDGTGYFDPEKKKILYEAKKKTNTALFLCNLGDIDNDGFPEIIFNQEVDGKYELLVLKRQPDGTYHNISGILGLSGINGKASTALLNDLDGDGDLDFYIITFDSGHNIHLENQTNNKRFLRIQAYGITSNNFAVGAQIRVFEDINKPDTLIGYRQVGMGGNPLCFSELGYLHFGLPALKTYDVKVVFPGGVERIRLDVPAGTTLDIYEYPVPERYFHLFINTVKRAFYFTNPLIEIPKLLFIVALLLLIRFVIARKVEAALFMHKWIILGFYLFFYIFAMIFFMGNSFWITNSLPLGGFAVLAAFGLFFDRSLSLLKKARFLGHYRLLEKLGEGGMGIVYKAKNIINRKVVALKILHPAVTGSEMNRKRFAREGAVMKKLEHPHIIKVLETGEIQGKGYICMELLTGRTLAELIKELGQLAFPLLVRIIVPVCDALSYIHEKEVFHRDLKSDNIFLLKVPSKAGNDKTWISRVLNSHITDQLIPVRLMDFGLAHDASMMTMTREGGLLGTLAYMSPEQVRGEKLDFTSDIFSLGVIIYESLTGQLPFQGEHEAAIIQSIINHNPRPLTVLNPVLPEKINAFVLRLLSKSKKERPLSINEVKSELILLNASDMEIEEKDPVALSYKGMALLEKGDSEEAFKLSSRALELLSTGLSGEGKGIYYHHYRILKSNGKNQEANTYLEKALNLVIHKEIPSFLSENIDRDIVKEWEINTLTPHWCSRSQYFIHHSRVNLTRKN